MSRAYDSSIQKQRNNETTRWQRVKTIIQMGLPLGSNRALLLNVIQWSAFLDYADDWRNWGESRSQSGRHPTDRVPLAERATSSAVWIIASVLLTKRTMECISPVEMLVFYYLLVARCITLLDWELLHVFKSWLWKYLSRYRFTAALPKT